MRQQLTIGTAEADAFAVWSNADADLVGAERAIRVVARVAAGCFTDLENLEAADCRLGSASSSTRTRFSRDGMASSPASSVDTKAHIDHLAPR